MGVTISAQASGVPLIITGTATVSGVLTLSLPSPPSNGEFVPVVQAGSIEGDFTEVVINTSYKGGGAYSHQHVEPAYSHAYTDTKWTHAAHCKMRDVPHTAK